MTRLEARIARARRRFAKVPPASPGWAEAMVAIHEADQHRMHAEAAIDRAEHAMEEGK